MNATAAYLKCTMYYQKTEDKTNLVKLSQS
jgi:hypothetical protein